MRLIHYQAMSEYLNLVYSVTIVCGGDSYLMEFDQSGVADVLERLDFYAKSSDYCLDDDAALVMKEAVVELADGVRIQLSSGDVLLVKENTSIAPGPA